MDDYQTEKALDLLGQLKKLDNLSLRITQTISLIDARLEVASLFHECSNLEHQLGKDWKINAWHRLSESVKLLLLQAEEETQSLPGCLPLDHGDCKLMELAFGLRGVVIEGYDFYALRREAGLS
jgi:hypothetical protein